MTPLTRVAIFLMMLGEERGRGIIALMDNSEIKAVVPEIGALTAVSPAAQRTVWAELRELGYEDTMNPSEALTILRRLFNGRKISGRIPRQGK